MAKECLEHCPLIRAQEYMAADHNYGPSAAQRLVDVVLDSERCKGPKELGMEEYRILIWKRMLTTFKCGKPYNQEQDA